MVTQTAAGYVNRLKSRLEQPENSQYDYNEWGTNAYDGVYAIALMLHRASEVLETKTFSDNTTRRLENFTYEDMEMKELFFSLLADVQFEGVSVSTCIVDNFKK